MSNIEVLLLLTGFCKRSSYDRLGLFLGTVDKRQADGLSLCTPPPWIVRSCELSFGMWTLSRSHVAINKVDMAPSGDVDAEASTAVELPIMTYERRVVSRCGHAVQYTQSR